MQRLTADIQRLLQPFSLPDAGQDIGCTFPIMSSACALDLTLRKSRAEFVVWPVRFSGNLQYNKGSMKRRDLFGEPQDLDSQSPMAVDLAIIPGLAKYGSSDGRNYNSYFVLQKMEVVCGLPEPEGVCGVPEPEIVCGNADHQDAQGKKSS